MQTETTAETATLAGIPGVRCCRCGEEDTLRVCVADGDVVCDNCDETVTADDMRAQAGLLTALADWVDTLPRLRPAGGGD